MGWEGRQWWVLLRGPPGQSPDKLLRGSQFLLRESASASLCCGCLHRAVGTRASERYPCRGGRVLTLQLPGRLYCLQYRNDQYWRPARSTCFLLCWERSMAGSVRRGQWMESGHTLWCREQGSHWVQLLAEEDSETWVDPGRLAADWYISIFNP